MDHRSLKHLFKKKDVNLRKRRWLELLIEYDITILYHTRKTNVVEDALSRKTESMGTLAFILAGEMPLAMDVQALANMFAHQYDPHLLDLKYTVHRGGSNEVSIDDDGVLLLQGWICVPNVDGLRELIFEEAHSLQYSINPSAAKMDDWFGFGKVLE
ncbi:uncharacterized protein [Nicotiana tomentosiformis]|uniref:uncharacterized protein n=1 Tax=Nicotiana tomentosiformis TaxID=4098 RepID=UPI00388CD369